MLLPGIAPVDPALTVVAYTAFAALLGSVAKQFFDRWDLNAKWEQEQKHAEIIQAKLDLAIEKARVAAEVALEVKEKLAAEAAELKERMDKLAEKK